MLFSQQKIKKKGGDAREEEKIRSNLNASKLT